MKRNRWVEVGVVGLIALTSACGSGRGGGLPEAATYAKSLPSERIGFICDRIRIGNFYWERDVRSDLRSSGASASEAEIGQRAEEISIYINDEMC